MHVYYRISAKQNIDNFNTVKIKEFKITISAIK